MARQKIRPAVFAGALILLLLAQFNGCASAATTMVSVPTGTATGVDLNEWQLRYRLFASFPEHFWCDPYLWPIARPDAEFNEAAVQFAAIEANRDEFAAILGYLNLDYKDKYSREEELLIFRQHNKLNGAVQLTGAAPLFKFVIRTGEGQGWRYEGTIDGQGRVSINKEEVSFNICPICLSRGTLINTPAGALPVENMRTGMTVWTVDTNGKRTAAVVMRTASTPMPEGWVMVKVILADGRSVTASHGHPTADGKLLGDYRVGDAIDGAIIAAIERVSYDETATFDLLPDGATGCYFANGILLGSTLS